LIRKLNTPPPPSGITEKIILQDNITLFPNPTSGKIKINNPDNLSIHSEIFNSMGQKVLSTEKSNSTTIELSLDDQAPGIYFIRLNYNEELIIKKIVKD
jgi:hypothetical protein